MFLWRITHVDRTSSTWHSPKTQNKGPLASKNLYTNRDYDIFHSYRRIAKS